MARSFVIQRKNVWPIIGYLTVLFIFMFGSLGYLQVETRTSLFSEDLGDVDGVCTQYTDTAFKEFKIMEYNKSRGFAEVLCLYEDPEENRSVELNQRNESQPWDAVVVNKINDDSSIYWPVYN